VSKTTSRSDEDTESIVDKKVTKSPTKWGDKAGIRGVDEERLRANMRLIKIAETYDGSGNCSRWLRDLEDQAKMVGCHDVVKVLPLLLKGEARDILETMGTWKRNEIKEVKKELLNVFGKSHLDSFRRFKRRRLGEYEKVDTFLAELQELGEEIEVSSEVVALAFVDGMPRQVAESLEVKMEAGASLRELLEEARIRLGHRAEHGRGYGGGLERARVRSDRQDVKGAESAIVCYKCGKEGHLKYNCVSGDKSGNC